METRNSKEVPKTTLLAGHVWPWRNLSKEETYESLWIHMIQLMAHLMPWDAEDDYGNLEAGHWQAVGRGIASERSRAVSLRSL